MSSIGLTAARAAAAAPSIVSSESGCPTSACAVLLDGRLVNSCLVMAAETEGARVTSVEGLAQQDGLLPVQEAFLDHAALQCGICTPGFLVATQALLAENPDPTEAQVRYWLAGNLCRCTGYDKIITAVLDPARRTSAPAS